MVFITTLCTRPLFSLALSVKGEGARRPVKESGQAVAEWRFPSEAMCSFVLLSLREKLGLDGWYVQILNYEEGMLQARKDALSLSITSGRGAIRVETMRTDLPLAKRLVNQVLTEIEDSLRSLSQEGTESPKGKGDLLRFLNSNCVSLDLEGNTKEEIITELVDILVKAGKVQDASLACRDLMEREASMSTGLEHGVALPHAKSASVAEMTVALGIKREGVDFEAADGGKSVFFVMLLSPKSGLNPHGEAVPHIRLLAAVSAALKRDEIRAQLLAAKTEREALDVLKQVV
jgi:fructose-specific phosphotransferase system IIA component